MPEQREAKHELPTLPGAPRYPAGDEPSIPTVLPLPENGEQPRSIGRAGQIILDLQMGEFSIRPGPAGEPIRVEADYDAGKFVLEENFVTDENGGWTYEVSFGGDGGWLGLLLGGGTSNVNNRIELIIPRDHPVDILGKVGLGELEADLGGLLIRHVDLEFGAGDHFVEFRDPLPYPMETFRAESSVGSVEVRSLGDASPRTVEVDHNIGELFLDLKGAWQNNAEVDVDFGIGECRLWLPDDVHIDMQRADVSIGESRIDRQSPRPVPEDAPTLELSMRGNIGEVRVEY
ncbi:MAG: hypothetical protein AAF657_15825 [Acidobacteriota bacterium]